MNSQDSTDIHYNEYIKWKTKYIKLIQILIQNQIGLGSKTKSSLQGFYITHSTSKLSNLLSILKDGKIKFGKDVAKHNRMISKGKAHKRIFTNIYFDDFINKSDNYMDFTIILDPKILLDFDTEFYSKWESHPESKKILELKKSDNPTTRLKKISEIKSYIKDSLKQKNNLQEHELVFNQPIDISKYILGVTCSNCLDDYPERYIQIKKHLKRNNRGHVKIIQKNKPLEYNFFS